jgi:hypothetical protein
MSMVTPTLNLPPPAPAAAMAKPALPAATPSAVPAPPAARPADVPSTTVTLSPQAQSALAAASHPPPAASPALTTAAAPMAHDGSVYESLKNGISAAVSDVGEAIAGGAHAVVDGVETTLSTANKMVQGALELPFAAVAKVCDAAGAVIDEL